MRILVTGGAGYIGSHAVKELIRAGHQVLVIDDLSNGHKKAVDHRATFIRGSTQDSDLIVSKIKLHEIEAVMHFAADIEVGESVTDPYKYYRNNFSNSVLLLEALNTCGIKKFVFSSTAAVYGNPELSPVKETAARMPINPYGRSKMMTEMAIEDGCHAYGTGYTILRYFNVAGASVDASIGEDHRPESHLIPRILCAAREGTVVKIFGTDYETSDGTCVRDYVHVIDLARAHVLAIEKIIPGKGNIYNLGSENGFSVQQVIAACEKVTGRKIIIQQSPRRAGDPPILVASSKKIQSELGWKPQYPDIESIVAHAWNWHTSHPEGYETEMEETHDPLTETASEEYRMAETYRYLGE